MNGTLITLRFSMENLELRINPIGTYSLTDEPNRFPSISIPHPRLQALPAALSYR